MDKFIKRKLSESGSNDGQSSRIRRNESNEPENITQPQPQPSNPSTPFTIDLTDLPWDPSDRPRMFDYHPNQRDKVRSLYWTRGPCQPRDHVFPMKLLGGKLRRFVVSWFDEFRWLEYSVKKDKAFCFCCYLFGEFVQDQGESDAFVTEGFGSWSRKSSFHMHVGNVNSFHNKALQKCEDLLKQKQSIDVAFHEQSDYRIQLNASIDVSRFLLQHGLPFHGYDEPESSHNEGIFLGLLNFLGDHVEHFRNVILRNASGNNQMVSPNIQKDIIDCFAKEVLKCIFDDIGSDVFGILVDDSSGVSKEEQMAVVLRYVDKSGLIKERFVGIVHVKETSASTLKSALDSLFAEHGVSLKQVRGQGYNATSNMVSDFNGLKALILKENSSAYYLHCFAHQLQLVVVAVAKEHDGVGDFFDKLALVMDVVGSSCKTKDMVRERYKERLEEAIGKGKVETERGLNQELLLIRVGDTRRSSHYKTIVRLIYLFPEVVKVLEHVREDGRHSLNRRQANAILLYFETFDFVFYLHLMSHILGLTEVLSRGLQIKDHDIMEKVSLIKGAKQVLQKFRESGFQSLLREVNSFCEKYNIEILDMAENYVTSRNRNTNILNRHYFEVDVFNTVLDMQIQELGDRFSEVTTELLTNMAALSPRDTFSVFNANKLVNLSKMYPYDFNDMDVYCLERELDVYIEVMCEDERFSNLKGIADLSRMIVETRRHLSFPLVYRLLKLCLVLPVATATDERCFSKIELIKLDLRNRMSDDFLNGALICAVEHETLCKVTNEAVIDRFQKMKNHGEQL